MSQCPYCGHDLGLHHTEGRWKRCNHMDEDAQQCGCRICGACGGLLEDVTECGLAKLKCARCGDVPWAQQSRKPQAAEKQNKLHDY